MISKLREKLTEKQRIRLEYALEYGECCFVKFPDGWLLGVNLHQMDFELLETQDLWSVSKWR